MKLRDQQLALAASRLTERDRELCLSLWKYRVLTSGQIAELAFTSQKRAKHRLLDLYRLGVVERFRPPAARGTGSQPYHYVLGPVGAWVVAGSKGLTVSALGYRRDHTLAIAYSQRLAHILGVNGFFTALAAVARRSSGGAELLRWWSEPRCAAMWGEYVRPDGYGRWREDREQIDFFLEYDRGTERPANRLTDRLKHYAELSEASGINTPVLMVLPSQRREAAVRRLLSHPAVAVATTYPIPDLRPSDAVWLPADYNSARRRLIALR